MDHTPTKGKEKTGLLSLARSHQKSRNICGLFDPKQAKGCFSGDGRNWRKRWPASKLPSFAKEKEEPTKITDDEILSITVPERRCTTNRRARRQLLLAA